MNKIAVIICCLYLIFSFSIISKAGEWRNIKPLYSKRIDVERKLGQPDKPGGRLYKLKNENVFIDYSDGECSSPDDWNVPKDTVLSISVYPAAGTLLLGNIKLDNSKFKIHKTFHEDVVEYRNDKDGIVYEVTNGKYVNEINFYPSAKGSHLSCSANARNLNFEQIRRIKPLLWTRVKVENLLGKPVKQNGTFYILKNWSIQIDYSNGVCKSADDWKVPKNTVTSVKIIPEALMLFSNLKVDETKFERVLNAIPGGFLYKNEEDGIVYEVSNGAEIPNTIGAIYFYPIATGILNKCLPNQ